jgi:urea transport system permease protein
MIAMVFIGPGLLAYIFGSMAFRSRVSGVYLSIMTQAMTYALMLAFFRNEMGFGGNNGLTDFKEIAGFSLQNPHTKLGLFVITALALGIGYWISNYIVNSKMGRVVTATRDAESRVRFVGYKPEHYKVWIFVVSAMLAGVAGALYVPQVGIINPGEFSPLNSIEMVVWVAIGGRCTLYGAIIGAIVVSYAKTRFTAIMPEAWLFALGGLFVLVTLLLPKGIAGLLPNLFDKLSMFNNDDKSKDSNKSETSEAEAK